MEENDVPPDNLELIKHPKVLKDLIKLKELQLRIDEAAISRASLKTKRKHFGTRRFFTFFFPALLQLVTVYAAYLAVVKSKFFESENNLTEARAIRLKIDADSLKSHKSRLHDSIARFTRDLNIEKGQLNNYTLTNSKLSAANAGLKGAIVKAKGLLLQFGATYYGAIIDSYPKDYIASDNNSIEYLIQQSKLPGDEDIIKKHIDDGLKSTSRDTLEHLVNLLHLSALGYFCFSNPSYRQEFTKYLSTYIRLQSAKKGDQAYGMELLNTVRYKKWTEKNIIENYSILFNDALRRHQEIKLVNLSMWTAFHILESNPSEKIRHMPDYWSEQHRLLLQLNTPLMLNDSVTIRDLDFLTDAKNNEISLLCECPQCYISLEAEVIHKYSNLLKISYKSTDSIPINMTVRRKGDDAVTINGSESVPGVKLACLLTMDYLDSYSPKVPPVRRKVDSLNNVISFDDIVKAKDTLEELKRFELYYQRNKEKFKYWLSFDRVNDISKSWFQEKLLTYNL